MSELECDDAFKKSAKAFRTTVPRLSSPVTTPTTSQGTPETMHVVCMVFPPDRLTLSKRACLRRYKSFIHEARIVCNKEDASAKDVYDALIPKGCVVQFLHVEFSTRVNCALVNVKSLSSIVSSVHVKVYRVEKDDILRAMYAVIRSGDFGIRISGLHDFTVDFVKSVYASLVLHGASGSNFLYEVARPYVVFWSEESSRLIP